MPKEYCFFMHHLSTSLFFPPVDSASPEGILAFGGDLSRERLLMAYHLGIFPWFDQDDPILWWAPPRRMVVVPAWYKAHKSVKSLLKKEFFQVTFNRDFEQVILGCQQVKRKNQNGTWLTDKMMESYLDLHRIGVAKSVEVWKENQMVGGLYGVDLGHVFTGESMFSKVPNASKVAFVWLLEKLKQENYQLLDCQVYNDHLAHLGAFEIDREVFMEILQKKSRIKDITSP